MLQQLDDFGKVFDPAVWRASIDEAERQLRRRSGGEIRSVPLIREHSDLVRFLFVEEAFVHVSNDRHNHLDRNHSRLSTPCFAHTTLPAARYSFPSNR